MPDTVWVLFQPSVPYECNGDLISIHATRESAEKTRSEQYYSADDYRVEEIEVVS